MYKALKNLTNGGELIPANTSDLTAEQLGGDETVERLLRLEAIEAAGTKKKAADKAEDKNAVQVDEIDNAGAKKGAK